MTPEQIAALLTALGAIISPILLYLQRPKSPPPTPVTGGPRPPVTPRVPPWQVILAAIIGGLVGFTLSILVGYISSILSYTSPKLTDTLPTAATLIDRKHVNVLAKSYWHDTGIKVQKGEWLEFSANGSWWSGISQTGPDGDSGSIFKKRPDCGQCPVPDGNLGELVGKVGDSLPFRIGRSTTREVHQDGNLMLAMNENTTSCAGGGAGSCYDDNSGGLEVTVTVYR